MDKMRENFHENVRVPFSCFDVWNSTERSPGDGASKEVDGKEFPGKKEKKKRK